MQAAELEFWTISSLAELGEPSNREMLVAVIKVYQQAFAGEPYFESYSDAEAGGVFSPS